MQEITLAEKEEEAVAAKLELMKSQKQAIIDRMMNTLAKGNADLVTRVFKAWITGMHVMVQERLRVKRFLQRILHSCAARCIVFWQQKVMDRIWVRKFVERSAEKRVLAAFKASFVHWKFLFMDDVMTTRLMTLFVAILRRVIVSDFKDAFARWKAFLYGAKWLDLETKFKNMEEVQEATTFKYLEKIKKTMQSLTGYPMPVVFTAWKTHTQTEVRSKAAAADAELNNEMEAERHLQAMQKLRVVFSAWQSIDVKQIFTAWHQLLSSRDHIVDIYRRQRAAQAFRRVFRAWARDYPAMLKREQVIIEKVGKRWTHMLNNRVFMAWLWYCNNRQRKRELLNNLHDNWLSTTTGGAFNLWRDWTEYIREERSVNAHNEIVVNILCRLDRRKLMQRMVVQWEKTVADGVRKELEAKVRTQRKAQCGTARRGISQRLTTSHIIPQHPTPYRSVRCSSRRWARYRPTWTS